jgi:NifU-like protein involved in Fe-S cluster formation
MKEGKLMNCKEIENRKKVSKEMEEKLLKTMKKTMKQKHLKRLSVAQYINDMQLTGKEKACLLGSMKNFEQLRRTYVKKSSNCQLLLEVS